MDGCECDWLREGGRRETGREIHSKIADGRTRSHFLTEREEEESQEETKEKREADENERRGRRPTKIPLPIRFC